MFHIGQKVVCVDAATRHPDYPCDLRKGAIYTIRGFNDGYSVPGIGVLLEEIQGRHWRPSGEERGYHPNRFRPVVERKTDISIFTRMLEPDHEQNVSRETTSNLSAVPPDDLRPVAQ